MGQNINKKRSNDDLDDHKMDKKESPRKKRKISENVAITIKNKMNECNASLLGLNGNEYLNNSQKCALYESFEFPQLIESVWNLSRKALIAAFINIELDLPTMSGLQTCLDLSWSIFSKFKDIDHEFDQFDDVLTLYKDFNKERIARNNILNQQQSQSQAMAMSEEQNGGTLISSNKNDNIRSFKWENFDSLDDDTSNDEESD